jgi:uncharacterized protein YcfJ
MSISKKMVMGLTVAVFSLTSVAALAQDRYGQDRYDQDRYDQDGYGPYDQDPDGRYDRGGYDYAKVVDVQPLTRRVKVTTPIRECWDETRIDDRRRGGPRSSAGGALLGAVIGGVIGHQIGDGRGRDAATAAGAVIGAGIGHREAERRNAGNLPPPREYTVQRCDTRYSDHWEERVDGYRVTYVYHGRRQVTQLPYKPGDRIRVRVDVSPAE